MLRQLNLKYVGIGVFVISCLLGVAYWYSISASRPQLVTLDLKRLLQEFVVESAQTDLEGAELEKHVDHYTRQLTHVSQELAKQENLIILPKHATIAGGVEITDSVKALIKAGYGADYAKKD